MIKPNIPYTYLLKCKPINKTYYGVRYSQKCNPEEFWKSYFTSSKIIHILIETYGLDSFEFEIRKTFDSAEKALEWEQTVLRRLKVSQKDNWLNQGLSGNNPNFYCIGRESWKKGVPNIKAKGTKFYNNGELQGMFIVGEQPEGWVLGRINVPWNKGLDINDPRVAEGSRKSTETIKIKGKKSWSKGLTKETHPSLMKTSITTKTRIQTGEIVPHGKGGLPKGTISCVDLYGQKHIVSVEEFHSRPDLIAHNTGISIKYNLVQCPHCGKEGGVNNMKRWHFDNCKNAKKEI